MRLSSSIAACLSRASCSGVTSTSAGMEIGEVTKMIGLIDKWIAEIREEVEVTPDEEKVAVQTMSGGEEFWDDVHGGTLPLDAVKQ